MSATTNAEIIAAVATLMAEMKSVHEAVSRVETKVQTIETTVTANDRWIADRKRDGYWLGGALVGIGVIGSWLVNKVLTILGF